MFMQSFLSALFRYSVRNPTIFKIVVFLRNSIPDSYLKVKSIIQGWKKYPIPEGIIDSVHSYAKANSFDFRVAKDAMVLHNAKPHTHTDLDESFKNNLQVRFTPQFTISIPQGRVVNQGFVISHDNRVLEEVSMMFNGSKPVYKKIDGSHKIFSTNLAKKPAEYIDGRVAVLATPSAQHNYYHWMMELLPRLQILKMSGYDLIDDIDYFFVNSTASKFQQETLRASGIPSHKIIDSIWHPHVCARELVVVSRTGINGFFDQHTVHFLRNLFKDHLQQKKSRKIYLNRHNVRHRKILNEDKLESLLINCGFESISLDNLSVPEQAALMSSSKIVVSGHGASLTNLVFCQQGTKVLELFQRKNIHPIYWGISNLLGLEYHYVKSIQEDNMHAESDEDNNFSDMVFDLEEVQKILHTMLEPTPRRKYHSA